MLSKIKTLDLAGHSPSEEPKSTIVYEDLLGQGNCAPQALIDSSKSGTMRRTAGACYR